MSSAALPRLPQLCSPTLPVGAYAYSQGLKSAVEQSWVRDEASAKAWTLGLLHHTVRRLNLPVFARLYSNPKSVVDVDTVLEVKRWEPNSLGKVADV